MRVGLVVPHIFMHGKILPEVIFSPAQLALDLAEGLHQAGAAVTLLSPGPVTTTASNITADLSLFERELALRGDTYVELLKKHPLTFISLARQVQAELLATAFAMANRDELDVIHVYTNEEDIALPFAQLCHKPVVFTHHDPFNFLIKYKNVFPKYKKLNWIALSEAQKKGMPAATNWVATIYHGLQQGIFASNYRPAGNYIAYLGRIIEPKGVHLAIAAVKLYNQTATKKVQLRIAGKHYAGHKKDTYWQERILPHIDNKEIIYEGFIGSTAHKQSFLGNARALIIPSLFEEPFGMVMIESLACGTPVIGLSSGAIPEVINKKCGIVVLKNKNNNPADEAANAQRLAKAIHRASAIDRKACRQEFEQRFTTTRMCAEHLALYQRLATE